MEIEFRSKRFPYLYRKAGEWPGIKVSRAKVLAGRMLEHTNSFHEVNVALAGELKTVKHSATGRNVKFCNKGGNLCITPAGQSVSASWDKPLDNLMITVEPELLTRTAEENHFSPRIEFGETLRDNDPLIQNIGLALLEETESETPSGRLFTDSLIQTFVLHLITNYSVLTRTTGRKGGLSGYRLKQVKDFVAANLEDDISLAELAAVAELSQFHFARAFNKSVGMTPQRYLMHQRIERAKELLSKHELPIVEVGLRAGFKNQSHFTTLFRKITSLTPKMWRDMRLA